MKRHCPLCGRRLPRKAKGPLMKLSRAERPTAFTAWMRQFYAAGQSALARHWEAQGYVYVPTEYPTDQAPPAPRAAAGAD